MLSGTLTMFSSYEVKLIVIFDIAEATFPDASCSWIATWGYELLSAKIFGGPTKILICLGVVVTGFVLISAYFDV